MSEISVWWKEMNVARCRDVGNDVGLQKTRWRCGVRRVKGKKTLRGGARRGGINTCRQSVKNNNCRRQKSLLKCGQDQWKNGHRIRYNWGALPFSDARVRDAVVRFFNWLITQITPVVPGPAAARIWRWGVGQFFEDDVHWVAPLCCCSEVVNLKKSSSHVDSFS